MIKQVSNFIDINSCKINSDTFTGLVVHLGPLLVSSIGGVLCALGARLEVVSQIVFGHPLVIAQGSTLVKRMKSNFAQRKHQSSKVFLS